LLALLQEDEGTMNRRVTTLDLLRWHSLASLVQGRVGHHVEPGRLRTQGLPAADGAGND